MPKEMSGPLLFHYENILNTNNPAKVKSPKNIETVDHLKHLLHKTIYVFIV